MDTIPKIISLSINLSKIDRSRIVEGKDGAKYVDVTLVNTANSNTLVPADNTFVVEEAASVHACIG